MERHVTPLPVTYKCVEVPEAAYHATPIGARYGEDGVVIDGTSDEERGTFLLVVRISS
jgi:hypothetical protein